MAKTTFGTNDALTVKTWAKALAVEVLKSTQIAPLIGDRPSSIVRFYRETQKGPGDKVTYPLLTQLQGDGVTSGQTLEGNEEALTYYNDALYIDELAHAVRIPYNGRNISDQRVQLSMRRDARDQLRNWFAKRLSVSFFNQVCGYTPQTNTLFTGLNSVSAPTNHVFSGTATADENLTSSDTFTLEMVDKCRELAETATWPLTPININGNEMYVLYMHPYQVYDMRRSTSSGEWLDIQKSALMGTGSERNPIFSGALGVYNGVVLRMAHDVTMGVNSSTGASISTVRRAVLLGAQAGAYAVGQNHQKADFKWAEETFDYNRELGVSALTIMGMKKCQFNGSDHGVIVASSYAASHT